MFGFDEVGESKRVRDDTVVNGRRRSESGVNAQRADLAEEMRR